MRFHGVWTLATLAVFSFFFLSSQPLSAATVWIGSDGAGPIQAYFGDLSSAYGPYGPSDGTAGAVNNYGGLVTVTPGDTLSTFNVFGESQVLRNSFTFSGGGQTGDYASYIIDITWGSADTLWASSFTGEVYHLSLTGAVLGQFATGTFSPGVTTDGTSLYTSSGAGLDTSSPNIYRRDMSGTVLSTIATSLNDTLGLGYDDTTGTLLVGGFDTVTRVSLNGATLNSYSIAGVHYGLEVGDLETPEPSSFTLLLGGFFVALGGLYRGVRFPRFASLRILAAVPVAALVSSTASFAAISVTSFTASPSEHGSVGAPATFTAVVDGAESSDVRYRFRVRPASGAYWLYRDYSPDPFFVWTPADTDGLYQVEVSAISRSTGASAVSTKFYPVTSRIIGSTPVANTTSHPLVALYSAPACSVGSSMRVRFKLPADVYWQSTSLKPCNGATSMNFYIAGMKPSSTYQLRHDILAGPRVTTGPTLTFTTAAAGIAAPAVTVAQALPAGTRSTDGITLFHGLLTIGNGPSFAVDPDGNLIWYNPTSPNYMTRPVKGGSFLQIFGQSNFLSVSGFREIDLVGNAIKETNVERVNDQLAALGLHSITTFHHDVSKLANGSYLALAMSERQGTLQGGADVLGDTILVLDNDLNVLWTWDAFEHLDGERAAVLGETVANASGNPLFLATRANDWLHGNSVALTPDGNIVYSARHQDLCYKISYQNGTGDGHVIWKLGKDGDFAWMSSDIYPWQSHQHDIEFQAANIVSLYDNGNTRIAHNGGHSRGMVLQLDEIHMQVTPLINADLGVYSFALGTAQRLSNGNYFFNSGFSQGGGPSTVVSEFTSTGAAASQLTTTTVNYRAFRLRDLYSAP